MLSIFISNHNAVLLHPLNLVYFLRNGSLLDTFLKFHFPTSRTDYYESSTLIASEPLLVVLEYIFSHPDCYLIFIPISLAWLSIWLVNYRVNLSCKTIRYSQPG